MLPTLSQWAQSRITALFNATTTEDFDSAFDAFLAHDVDSIVVNGEKLTKDQYRSNLQTARALEKSAEVKFLGTFQHFNDFDFIFDDVGMLQAGEVGLFLQAEVIEKMYIFGVAASVTVNASFNLK
ncbi:hypothetical protein BDY19DRAFT_880141 [Irpex rosettiformis]|uniref:Uncharacterized protein n=1 Tax=Irpex rosettiformis TaxID=378272 RepID=A0ACB8UIR3_9APHY|nr:hypothetical protein BDY19DRAFT_880141 [Irpex rosettiformis]